MILDSLKTLYIHELHDLYDAEHQLLKALPKMAKAASSEDLKTAFETHLDETEHQITRLEEIFAKLELPLRAPKCKAMEGLVEEGKTAIEEDMDEQVRDAALIAAAQRVEHYEIAGYGCARTFARQLGHDEIADTLQTILDEEKATDEKLTELAMQHINEEAAAGAS